VERTDAAKNKCLGSKVLRNLSQEKRREKKTQKNTKKHNTDDVCGEREKSEQMDKSNMKPIEKKNKKKKKLKKKRWSGNKHPKMGEATL